MIERYEKRADATPHEATFLVVDDEETCFDATYGDVLAEVEGQLSCEPLSVIEHYEAPDDLPEYDTLIQYNVWLVSHEALLIDGEATMLSYLCSESFPDETLVVVVVDDPEDESIGQYVQEEISDELVTLDSRTALVSFLLGYLKTASPCSVAGLEHIMAWNNEIADQVGPARRLE